ncbi:hypothetical protein ACJX0J_020808, partial [Zea mays]
MAQRDKITMLKNKRPLTTIYLYNITSTTFLLFLTAKEIYGRNSAGYSLAILLFPSLDMFMFFMPKSGFSPNKMELPFILTSWHSTNDSEYEYAQELSTIIDVEVK